MNLSKKTCKACEGTEKPFTLSQINEYLQHVKDWEIINNGTAIEKEFVFKDFKEALNFINKVGEIAEQENHHPDILLYSYKKVKITISTHAIKGLSENDFILASKIDKIILF